MAGYQNENLSEIVKQKIKLFTKESYFKYFNYILIEKSKNLSAFKKISSLSYSIDLLSKEKYKLRSKEKKLSLWHIIMSLICNNNTKNLDYYKKNDFNLNPICYSYITNLCQKKMKLLIAFSISHKLPLEMLVKYYLDLCTNQINQKEFYNNTQNETNINNNINNYNTNILNKSRASRLIDFRKIIKKSNQKNLLKEQNSYGINNNSNNITTNNNIMDKKNSNQKGKQLEYSNSFTRLFIGEIDPNSVKERFLSNMVVKKKIQLHLYSSYTELSNMYLKRLYKKLFKKDNKDAIDNDIVTVINQFKNDAGVVQNYQRNILVIEKKNNKEKEYDEVKEKLENELKNQKKLYMEQNNENYNSNINNINNYSNGKFKKRKKTRFLSLSPNSQNINFNKILFNPKKKSFNRLNYYNFNNNNCLNNEKNHCLSFNISSNRIRNTSEKNNSRLNIRKEMSPRIGMSNSTINIKFKNNNINPKFNTLFINDLKIKKNSFKRSNSILMGIKKKYEKFNEKNIFEKKKNYKLKNFLNRNDFFFTKIN